MVPVLAARRRRDAYIARVSESQCISPLSVPVYFGNLWEPSSNSEGSVEIEVEVTSEAEILSTQSATPVW